VATNEQVLGRLQRNASPSAGSRPCSTVTLGFALLLITVLLTVSVNQRLGEIAALQPSAFRGRVVAGVLCESPLIVGTGGLLSLPLGDAGAGFSTPSTKPCPAFRPRCKFFVFDRRAGLHVTLSASPRWSRCVHSGRRRLPIATTLRNEVLS
jgi:hypothetical protein